MSKELSTNEVKEKIIRFFSELMSQGVSARELAEALWDLIGKEEDGDDGESKGPGKVST